MMWRAGDMSGPLSHGPLQQENPGQLHFPIRPRPKPGEATLSYVIRVAQANGYGTLSQLWQAVLKGGQSGPLDSLLSKLDITQSDWDLLIGPLPSYWKIPVRLAEGLSSNDYNHSLIRWCPACLEEAPYLRVPWGLKLQSVCVRHQLQLADQCPVCGAHQRQGRIELVHCACGARLSATAHESVPPEMAQLNDWLAAGSMEGEGLGPRLSAAEWHRLVRYLGQFTLGTWPGRPGQVSGQHRLDRASTLIQNTVALLPDWPRHFHELIAVIRACAPDSHSLSRTFKPLYGVIYGDLPAPGYQFLRDAFEDYLHEHWWGLVCRRNKRLRPDTVASHPSMTLKQAAQSAGTSPAVVRHLVQAALIPVDEAPLRCGRHTRSIHQREVERISAVTQGSLSLKATAVVLALPKHRVRELVAAGILKPVISRPAQQSAAWLFTRDELAPLSAVAGTGHSASETVTLNRILRTWRLRKTEFPSLVQALADGALVSMAEVALPIGKIILGSEQVRSWLREFRSQTNSGISIDEAARYLGLKQQVAYGLVAIGLLDSAATAAGKRIRMEHMRAFQADFVSLAELAQRQGHSPRSVLRTMEAEPVCGPSIDGSRQYFFRRQDLGVAGRDPTL
ncbi:MAG: TniQ family protein [Thiobacillus sp.]